MGDNLPAVIPPDEDGPWQVTSGVGPGTGPEHLTSQALSTAEGRYQWPDHELTAGIALVEIHTYGDQPGHAAVTVTGRGRKAVEAAHARACALVSARVLVPLFQDDSG